MVQTRPSYYYSIGKIEHEIINLLRNNPKIKDILNILVLIKDDKTISYILEKNILNINSKITPNSNSNILFHYLDLSSNTKQIDPENNELKFLLDNKYQKLSDFILSNNNINYFSIDIDYAFNTTHGWVGFEFTTFFMPFINKQEAERLIIKINRRPSWKGQYGSIALKRIVDSAHDLNIDMYMVCANTMKRIGSKLKTDGNCYLFKLNHDQIKRLEQGLVPNDAVFCRFNEFPNKIMINQNS